MNILSEVYPSSMEDLISKCEKNIVLINQLFNNPNCKLLSELYKTNEINGETERQNEAFGSMELTLNSKLNKKVKEINEIQGMYLFGEKVENQIIPRYVGISRTIFRRLRQHGWGKYHNEATFAYLQAKSNKNHTGKRSDLDFKEEQKRIREYKVVIIPELKDYDLYFMEVYIAGKLKTQWNSFKTH